MPPRPQPESEKSPTTLDELQESLSREEKKTGRSGAVPLTPKQDLLDARDLEAENPDKHFRFINEGNRDNVRMRQTREGYERVPESEGGRQVGNLALYRQNAEIHRERKEREAQMNNERLSQHNREVEEAAETIARHLRDKHGVDIEARDIIVKG